MFRSYQHLRLPWLVIAIVLLCVAPVQAIGAEPVSEVASDIAIRVELTPENASLEEQVLSWAGQPSGKSDRDRRYWLRELPERIALALESVGWYQADVTVTESAEGVAIRVSSAVVVNLNEVAIDIPGAIVRTPALIDWLEQNSPELGVQLDHTVYESLRENLINRAIALGFLEAQYARQRLLVSVSARSASIDLLLKLGPAYRIGEIKIDSSAIRSDIVRNIAPFVEGDPYTADALSEYARRLRESRFFSSARVIPEIDQIADGAVPLRVQLEPRKANRIRLGTGYASDVGLRLRAGWDRFLFDDRGHSAAFDVELSALRRSANAEYRVPDVDRPATRAWLYSAGALRESIDGTASTQQNARVARERRYSNGLVETTYLRYQRDRGLPEDSSVEFQALMAGLDVQHGWQMRLGDAHRVALDGSMQWLVAHKDLGADFGFLRAYGRLSALLEMWPRHWLRGRLELGQLWRADIDTMPMSLRFFAGGDGSVRGFGPRDASPQDTEGTATGGSQLAVFSLEYEYRFRQAWGVAAFVDQGRAWVNANEPTRVGAGLGLRWYSPVGPVMLDLAKPVAEGDGDWRVHVTIGL